MKANKMYSFSVDNKSRGELGARLPGKLAWVSRINRTLTGGKKNKTASYNDSYR